NEAGEDRRPGSSTFRFAYQAARWSPELAGSGESRLTPRRRTRISPQRLTQTPELFEVALDGLGQEPLAMRVGPLPLIEALAQVLQNIFHPQELGFAIHCCPLTRLALAGLVWDVRAVKHPACQSLVSYPTRRASSRSTRRN